MTTLVIVEAKLKADSVEKMKALMTEILPDTLAFEGCRGITPHTNVDDRQSLLLVEQWESKGHYEKYLAWRKETGDLDRIIALIEGAPSIRYFEDLNG